MPRAGGEADKLGNSYEAVWTANAIVDVFLGKYRAISVEALDDKAEGVEFHLENPDGSLQFHSVKRQKQGGDWSVADLCRTDVSTGRSILGDLFSKLEKYHALRANMTETLAPLFITVEGLEGRPTSSTNSSQAK